MPSASGPVCCSSRRAVGGNALLALAGVLAVAACLAAAPGPAAAGSPNPVLERWRVERIRRLGPLVRAVHFVGNETFSERELLTYMRTTPGGLFRAVHHSRGTLDRDLANLERFYRSQGFLEATAGLEDIALAADGLSVELLVGIDERDRWRVTAVVFEGNRALDEALLRSVISVREGDPLLSEALAADRDAVLSEYARRSYLDARVEQTVERDDDARSATVRYAVVERDPATIGGIAIEGALKTRDHVLEREFRFAVGRLFDVNEIGETQAALYRTGLFNSVRIEPAPGDTGRPERRLLVRVRERPSVRLDLTAGYAVLDGYEAGFEVSNRNLQGQATTAGLRARVSEFVREAEASVGDPWFLGVPLAVSAGARYAWRDESAYAAETVGLDAGASKRFGRSLTLMGGYTFERTVVLETVEGGGLGANYTSNVTVGASHDTRDDILNARRGAFAGARVDVASSRLGGTNNFVRTEVFARGFAPVGGRVVGGLALRFGWIRPGEGGGVPVNERYTAGGDGSVRGYDRNSLGPSAGGAAVGGLALLEVRAEARVRVWRGFSVVAFADAGQAFAETDAVRLDGLAVGAGGGLRYDTRIGVLRFDLAAPVTEPGPSAFYVGVGQAF
ncbi:MAG: BamA/TamA family outer membrane protein [Candidatus Eisenbacteria bacterium]|nr:BamA/TamA family outer membrane protein [Candidatus Eisenbacteria bacterium]